jgi:hypothetical protein
VLARLPPPPCLLASPTLVQAETLASCVHSLESSALEGSSSTVLLHH